MVSVCLSPKARSREAVLVAEINFTRVAHGGEDDHFASTFAFSLKYFEEMIFDDRKIIGLS